jgi:hypothetical protein
MFRLAPLLFLLACGGTPAPAIGSGGGPSPPSMSAAPPAPMTPAPSRDPKAHPPLFHLDAQGGPVLPAMELWTVVWKGDDALGAKVDAFHGAMLASDYWTSRLGEYGIGKGVAKGVIVLDTAAPATLDDSAMPGIIAGPKFPAANANTVFAFVVPPSTLVTNQGENGCGQFGGYHFETPKGVPYILDLQCDATMDTLTIVASHEAAETATDPHPASHPAYYTQGTGEIADVCLGSPATLSTATDAYAVTRLYSNTVAAADGSEDPCGPSPPDRPFFDVAMVPSQIMVQTDLTGAGTTDLSLEPFSYGQVGPMKWQLLLNLGAGAPGIHVSQMAGSSQAGATVPLKVTVSADAQSGQYPFSILVTAKDGWESQWFGTLTIQ